MSFENKMKLKVLEIFQSLSSNVPFDCTTIKTCWRVWISIRSKDMTKAFQTTKLRSETAFWTKRTTVPGASLTRFATHPVAYLPQVFH
jgi:hypothetical protein